LKDLTAGRVTFNTGL